jgi:hypothetical protein
VSRLGPGVVDAFTLAARELGMCSAAWLFVQEVAEHGGSELVHELRDLLGRDYPTLDTVATSWDEGRRAPTIDIAPILAACAGVSRLLIVGIESMFLDVLVPALGETRASVLVDNEIATDWGRVLANYRGLEAVDLSSFQGLAGRRSALLTFLYGTSDEATWVDPVWMRVIGGDVRMQFRSIIGWDVLGTVSYLYPRWKTEAPLSDFTHVIRT